MIRRSDAEIARTRAFWVANRRRETHAPAFGLEGPVWWHVTLALAVALIAQASFAPAIAIRGVTPSLVTLVVAWYALRSGVARGLAFGLFAGACEDALGGASGVAWTFATGIAGGLAGRLARTWLADIPPVLALGAALLTFGRFALFALALALEGRSAYLGAHHVRLALWQSALDGALALVALSRVPSLGGLDAHRR
ncbi:MAG: hypothetical protein NVS2B3_15880 [Vulcanimicrobiaceae bacterium]